MMATLEMIKANQNIGYWLLTIDYFIDLHRIVYIVNTISKATVTHHSAIHKNQT